MEKNILKKLSLVNLERSYKLMPVYGKELVWAILGSVFKVLTDEDLHPMGGGGAHSSVSFALSGLTLGPSKLACTLFS